jgi:hypothetical protein
MLLMLGDDNETRAQDMDQTRCGTVPEACVERALCRRGLLQLVSARERDLVCKCFGYQRGCAQEVFSLFPIDFKHSFHFWLFFYSSGKGIYLLRTLVWRKFHF